MRLLLVLLRPVYYLLYHHFAWTYDIVADLVSLGQWRTWVRTAMPHLHGRILEIGFGPGHLQSMMHGTGLTAFGVDESRFMVRQASRRLRRESAPLRLMRGLSQAISCPAETFDTVVATFPAEYILDLQTLAEVSRVLVPGGTFVIVPFAWITGIRPLERFTAWLMRVSGEVPGKPGFMPAAWQIQLSACGFELSRELISLPRSQVLLLSAKKR